MLKRKFPQCQNGSRAIKYLSNSYLKLEDGLMHNYIPSCSTFNMPLTVLPVKIHNYILLVNSTCPLLLYFWLSTVLEDMLSFLVNCCTVYWESFVEIEFLKFCKIDSICETLIRESFFAKIAKSRYSQKFYSVKLSQYMVCP